MYCFVLCETVNLWIDLVHYKYPSTPHFLFISQKVETWKLASLDVEWLLSFLAEQFERNHSHPRRSTWEPNRCQVLENGFHRAYSPLQAESVDEYWMKQTVEDLCLLPILMDLEPGTMDSVKSGPYGMIFGQTDNLIFGILWMPTSTQGIRYLIWNMKYGYDQ